MKEDDLYYQDFKDLADLFFCITENKILKERIEKALEELVLWNPKIEILKIERDALINILRGEDK